MASFSFSNSMISETFSQRVMVNGQTRSDIYCVSTSHAIGPDGSQASFLIPGVTWDGNKNQYRGKFVTVDAAYESGPLKRIFSGYITEAKGSNSGNVTELQAESIIGMSDSFYIGEANLANALVAGYPEKAYIDGVFTETGWNVKNILRDWFQSSIPNWKHGGYGNGNLRSEVRSRLKLGTLSALSTQWNNFPIGDLILRQTTLRDGLEQLLGILGTVSFRERFDGNDTYLDFFELGDPSAPERIMRVAGENESIAGTNVNTIDHSEGADDVVTKMIGYGSERKCVITITTDDALSPNWNSSLEAGVLNNLESTKSGKNQIRTEYSEAKAKVFREFNISEDFRNYIIDKDNALELSDGSKLPVQVLMWDNDLSFSGGTYTGSAAPNPTLLAGAELDIENLRLRLKEPAVKVVSAGVDGNNVPFVNFAKAKVGLTMTVNIEKLYHEAESSNSLDLDGIEDLTEVVENTNFGFVQTTNQNFPIGGTTYPCIYQIGSVWTNNSTAVVYQNDEAKLIEFTELALIEKNQIKTNYQISTPFYSSAYRLGDRVRIIGQNDFEFGTHQITSLSHNLTNDHSTTFSTDNAVPLIANTILSSGE